MSEWVVDRVCTCDCGEGGVEVGQVGDAVDARAHAMGRHAGEPAAPYIRVDPHSPLEVIPLAAAQWEVVRGVGRTAESGAAYLYTCVMLMYVPAHIFVKKNNNKKRHTGNSHSQIS